jgi:putative DNA primase/helicase
MRRYLQVGIGYSLTGRTDEQCVFINHGGGKNGKSVCFAVVRRMLGDYAQQADFKTFVERRNPDAPRNDVARMLAVRFLTTGEGSQNGILDEALIKQSSGGDPLTARFLRQEFFEFTPQFKLWLPTNHKPVIRGTDEGIWRRVKLVPWEVTIPEAERKPFAKFVDELCEELPGILAWAVEGCRLWQRDGLGEPEAVKHATTEYRQGQDVLGTFLSEHCRIHPHASVKFSALYERYAEWCRDSNERAVDSRTFGDDLTNRGYPAARQGGHAVRQGLALNLQSDVAVDVLTNGARGTRAVMP